MELLLLVQPRAIAPQSALEPAGEAAAEIGWLWNVMLVAGTAVTVLVVALLLYALFRPRREDEPPPEADRPPDPHGEHANVERAGGGSDTGAPRSEKVGTWGMIVGGVAFPVIVLVILYFLSLDALAAIFPRPQEETPLTIEITGKQWWWQVRYLGAEPSATVVTANEIYIPAGERVRVHLRSDDVIHSFWVPGLQGKVDMIPGRTNVSWLHANEPGVWRGQCAEFCGLQHAKMALTVVAVPPDTFALWLDRQRQPAAEPSDSALLAARETFLQTGCALCHAVRGTPAMAAAGPDLTHVASRRTLAAGELPNNLGNLYGWVANPQALKPGSKMPAVPLTNDELHSIVRYLRTLQ